MFGDRFSFHERIPGYCGPFPFLPKDRLAEHQNYGSVGRLANQQPAGDILGEIVAGRNTSLHTESLDGSETEGSTAPCLDQALAPAKNLLPQPETFTSNHAKLLRGALAESPFLILASVRNRLLPVGITVASQTRAPFRTGSEDIAPPFLDLVSPSPT